MKSFINWFKASTKVKRWILLTVVGVVLISYAFANIIVADEISFVDLGKTIIMFVAGFVCVVTSVIFIQKRNLELIIEANNSQDSDLKINSLIFNRKVYDEGPKVVIIGGGDGLNTVIHGMRKYTNNITAVVTMADMGNSDNEDMIENLSFSDVKNSIVSLSDNEETLRRLFDLRFNSSRLRGINFGDIYLEALKELYTSPSQAIEKSTELLNISGNVVPVTLDKITISAELADGTVVRDKNRISEVVSEKVSSISRVTITPNNVKPAPGVIEAINEADAIIMGPGSLYTNILPCLLVRGIATAIKESKALKFYISNIMTEPGQTDNYSVSDHLKAIKEHAGMDIIDYCLADTGEVVPEYVRMYNKEGAEVVELDREKVGECNVKLLMRDMSTIKDNRIRHDPDLIASIIIEMICNDLKFRDKQNDTEFLLINSILKDQKKIQARAEKQAKREKKEHEKEEPKKAPRRKSKFSSKYADRLEAIQNVDQIKERNRNALKEESKRKRENNEKGKRVAKDSNE